MTLTILILIAFIILTVVIIRNNPLKKGKDVFTASNNNLENKELFNTTIYPMGDGMSVSVWKGHNK